MAGEMMVDTLTLPELREKLANILVNGALYRRFVYIANACHLTDEQSMQRLRFSLLPERLKMFCPHQACQQETQWGVYDPRFFFGDEIRDYDYQCKNCGERSVHYSLIWQEGKVESVFIKVAQWPPLSIQPPSELAQALGDEDCALYSKALINANFNHGIGALAYFRRVIENKVNLLLDLVADAAKLAGVDEAGLQELERVKATHQVDRKIEIASKLLPAHLKPPGSPDPLDRLYKSYSSGLHGESDEKCLDIFKEGRFVFEYLFRTLTVGNEEAGEYIKRLSAEPSREKKSLQAKRRALRGKTRAHYTRPSAPVGSRRASGEALTSNVSTLTPRLMAASL